MQTAVQCFVKLQTLEEEARKFWEKLDEVILWPRTNIEAPTLRYVQIDMVSWIIPEPKALVFLRFLCLCYPFFHSTHNHWI